MEKKIITILFVLYCIYIVNLTLIRKEVVIYQTYNFEVFKNLMMVYSHSKSTFFYLFLGNIFVFVPFGIFYRYLFKFSYFRVIVTVFLTSLCIESMQFIFNVGVFEIDDLILNTIGGIVGCLMYIIVERKKKDV